MKSLFDTFIKIIFGGPKYKSGACTSVRSHVLRDIKFTFSFHEIKTRDEVLFYNPYTIIRSTSQTKGPKKSKLPMSTRERTVDLFI